MWNTNDHPRSPALPAPDRRMIITGWLHFSDEGPDSRFPSSPVTDTGAAHGCRARRVHRAPHPRASTTSLNPAERSAAEIRRESHRPRAACRGGRATLGFDIQRKGAPPSPGRAGPPKRAGDSLEAEREPRPRASSRETPPTRNTSSTAGAHAPTTPGVLSCPRLAWSSPTRARCPAKRPCETGISSKRVELDARPARDSRHLRTVP